MELVRILFSRCAALFLGRNLDEELDEELRAHIDLAVEENLKRGMSEAEARRDARVRWSDANERSVPDAARSSVSRVASARCAVCLASTAQVAGFHVDDGLDPHSR